MMNKQIIESQDKSINYSNLNQDVVSTAPSKNVDRSKIENWGATRQTGAQIGLNIANTIFNPIIGAIKIVSGVLIGITKTVSGQNKYSTASNLIFDGLNQVAVRPIMETIDLIAAMYDLGYYAVTRNLRNETRSKESFQRITEKSTQKLSFQENSSYHEAGINYFSNLIEIRELVTIKKININDYPFYDSADKGRNSGKNKFSYPNKNEIIYVDKDFPFSWNKDEIDEYNDLKERNSNNAFKSVSEKYTKHEAEYNKSKATDAVNRYFNKEDTNSTTIV